MAITIDGAGTITGLSATGISAQPVFAGQVLQVVNATHLTQVTSSSSVFIETGLTATITPTSATSKILVLINHASCLKNNADASNFIQMILQKNSVDLVFLASSGGFTGTAINLYFTISYVHLDSPATTSATTYRTVFRNPSNFASVSVQADGVVPSTITLMEIAA